MCAGGVGVALCDVTCPAWCDAVGDGAPAGLFEGADHFQHAVAASGAQIDDQRSCLLRQDGQGGQVALGQVDNMDVVAHAGAVHGGVVVAKDGQLGQLAAGHLGNEWHEVVGNACRVFTQHAGSVGANRIEITQQGNPPGRVAAGQVLQYFFQHQFAATVGIGGGEREVLAYRYAVRVAIDSCRGGKHQLMHARFGHALEQYQAAGQVVVVIAQGLGDGFAHGFVACKMNDCRERMFGKQRTQSRAVADVGLHVQGAAPGDLRNAFDDGRFAVAVVVEDQYIAPRRQ